MPEKRSRKRSKNSKSSGASGSRSKTSIIKSQANSDPLDEGLKIHVAALQKHLRIIFEKCLDDGGNQSECRSQVIRYLRDLGVSSKRLITLQSKELAGLKLSESEQQAQEEIQAQYTEMQEGTDELESAKMELQFAMQRWQSLERFHKGMKTTTLTQDKFLSKSQSDYATALSNLKRILLNLFQKKWVVHTVLAIGFFGALAYKGYNAWIDAALVSTAFLQEAKHMAQTIDSATDLIQVGSHEAKRWAVASAGGLVGAANGLLFSSLFPGPTGKKTASVLSLAALGVFIGIRRLY